jgi:hypothetical protein
LKEEQEKATGHGESLPELFLTEALGPAWFKNSEKDLEEWRRDPDCDLKPSDCAFAGLVIFRHDTLRPFCNHSSLDLEERLIGMLATAFSETQFSSSDRPTPHL